MVPAVHYWQKAGEPGHCDRCEKFAAALMALLNNYSARSARRAGKEQKDNNKMKIISVFLTVCGLVAAQRRRLQVQFSTQPKSTPGWRWRAPVYRITSGSPNHQGH